MKFIKLDIKNKKYDLRITTRDIVNLEDELGYNPLKIFANLKVNDTVPIKSLVLVFQYAVSTKNKAYTIDEAYDLFDEWIACGHSYAEFVNIVIDLFKESGLIQVKN